MKTRLNNRNGFTLVEAVVTAVIIAILAIVAIPLYQGYVQDTRQSTVDNLAQTAAAAANAFWRKTGEDPVDEDALNVFHDATRYSITINGNTIEVSDLRFTDITAEVDFRPDD